MLVKIMYHTVEGYYNKDLTNRLRKPYKGLIKPYFSNGRLRIHPVVNVNLKFSGT